MQSVILPSIPAIGDLGSLRTLHSAILRFATNKHIIDDPHSLQLV